MAVFRHNLRRASALLAPFALLGACGGGGSSPRYGIERRVEVAPLPLPTGLPQPLPVQLTFAFPGLLFDRPLFLCAPPDGSDRVVVVEQAGRVHVFPNDPGASATTVMLDLSAVVQFGGEEGLLGFAFHPDFANNDRFYVYYTRGQPRRSVLSRWRMSPGDPNVADPASEEVLLEVEQPFGNHNAGSLAFGPDGKLYVALGDGGSGNDPFGNAQDPTTLLGSILRLEDDGSVPADNPFVGATGGQRPEIWAYGLRNPWRTSFDPTGRLWVGDVGQNDREEIDIVERGGNYGWRVYEGFRENINPEGLPPTAFEQPIHDYGRAQGASITGGYVYRGAAVPALQGAYVYGDMVSGRIHALVYDGVSVSQDLQIVQTNSPASFGEDAAGELYVCCFDGRIRKFVPDATPAGPAEMPALLSQTGLFADTAALSPSPGVLEYDVTARLWSDGASKRRFLALPGRSRVTFAATGAYGFPVGTALVKHFEIADPSGGAQRLETRVLLHTRGGWAGYSYRWNQSGTDAALVADGGDAFAYEVVAPGGGPPAQRTWTIPSRVQCLSCHSAAAGRVLGVRTRLLNRDFPFPLLVDNQLRVWNHLGLFDVDIGDAGAYGRFVDPDDAAAPVAGRARAYLDVNCAGCHRPGAPTPVDLDLRHDTPVADMRLFSVAATSPVPGGVGLRAVAGDRAQSDLWLRVTRRDAYAMPPLGSHVVDPDGAELIGRWIDEDPTAGGQ